MEHLSDNNKIMLRKMGHETENRVLNLFQLAEIEDRYTEKEVIMEGCAVMKALLDELDNHYF